LQALIAAERLQSSNVAFGVRLAGWVRLSGLNLVGEADPGYVYFFALHRHVPNPANLISSAVVRK
jgi:hypothetical protein